MGRAGPTNWAGRSPKRVGPESAQNGLGRSRPKKTLLLNLGQIWPRRQYSWARTRLAQRRKKQMLGQNQPGPATYRTWGEGELFSPSPPACKTLICMQERTNKKCNQWRGRRTYLARRRRPLADQNASMVVLWWRPVAVSWLTDGGSKRRCCCFKRWRVRLLLFPSPPYAFLFFRFRWFPFILPVCCQVSYPVSSFSFLSV